MAGTGTGLEDYPLSCCDHLAAGFCALPAFVLMVGIAVMHGLPEVFKIKLSEAYLL